MKCYFSQVYIDPNARFYFSHKFQKTLGEIVNREILDWNGFALIFDSEFNLIINISAKSGIAYPEIVGPGVFRKNRTVEFTVFIPYAADCRNDRDCLFNVLEDLFRGLDIILRDMSIKFNDLNSARQVMFEMVLGDPDMMRS
jgi:hypothetical protein